MNSFTSTKNKPLSRRQLLGTMGGLFAFNPLSGLFANDEKNTPDKIRIKTPIKSVIFLNMAGGMSHVDTLDPKKATGQFRGMRSKLAGAQISTVMRRSALQLKDYSLVRSLSSSQGDHSRAQFLLHTGYDMGAGFPDIPSLGAIIAFAHHKKGPYFPQHITLGGRGRMIGRGGFLGTHYNSYHIGNPERPLSNAAVPHWLTEERLFQREQFLDILNEAFRKKVTSKQTDQWKQMQSAALDFMNSEKLAVFDLKKESERSRKRYGNNRIGQSLLLAKRLAQAEVPFIEVTVGGWDTHADNKDRVANIMRELDPALATLLGELRSSGLMKQTLFVMTSEFGRTPRMASNGNGRDHFPSAWSALIGGGNIAKGVVVGATDKKGEKVTKDPVSMPDLVATIYKAAGIDHEASLQSSFGRPFPLLAKGAPINKLI